MKRANECGVPMDIGPIISDRKSQLSRFYKKSDFMKQLKILGSAQIVLGVISIIAHAINMVIHGIVYLRGLQKVGYGFWNGAIFLLTGTMGVASGMQRYGITTILFGFMSILSACLTVALFTLAMVSAIICGIDEYGKDIHPKEQILATAMEIIMAVVALVEAFVAIRSVLTVRKTAISCCRDESGQPNRTPSQPFLSCGVGSCFCHCAGSCHLPSYSSSDQLSLIDPEPCLVGGGLSLRDESNEKRSTTMDDELPLLFY